MTSGVSVKGRRTVNTSCQEHALLVILRCFLEKQWLIPFYCLVVLSCTHFSKAQLTPDSQIPEPSLVTRCHRVWLVSENTATNTVLISEKLRLRGELTDARIALANSETEADVAVKITGDENDAMLFVSRKADGANATSKVVALAEFPGILAGSIVDTLHELCPAVMTTSRWLRSGPEPLPTTAVIQIAAARSVSVTSKTSAIDENKLARYLRRQPEVHAWELSIDVDSPSDDLIIEIDRDLQSLIEWKYEVSNRSGDPLLGGWVGALNQQHATEAITRSLLRQFRLCKPARTRSTMLMPKFKADRLGARRAFRVRLVTEGPKTTGTLLNLTADAEKLLATNSLGQEVLRIEAPDFEDVVSSSVRDAALDCPDQFMNVVGFLTLMPTPASLLGPALSAGYTGASVFSAPVSPKTHLIDIAWHDGHSYQAATLQVQARDVAPLMRALRSLQVSQ
jgi:hypothetical protein